VLALSTGRIVELAAVTALLYLAMSWPLAILSRWFERRLERPAGPSA
jgi:ABC-type amino acid transport system permease subunit